MDVWQVKKRQGQSCKKCSSKVVRRVTWNHHFPTNFFSFSCSQAAEAAAQRAQKMASEAASRAREVELVSTRLDNLILILPENTKSIDTNKIYQEIAGSCIHHHRSILKRNRAS